MRYGILLSLFLILVATGVLLMVYYKPSVDLAYDSIKDIHYVVPTGRFIRNIHRWAAHLMVACVLLHMTPEEFDDFIQKTLSEAGLDELETVPFVIEGRFSSLDLHVLNGNCPFAEVKVEIEDENASHKAQRCARRSRRILC